MDEKSLQLIRANKELRTQTKQFKDDFEDFIEAVWTVSDEGSLAFADMELTLPGEAIWLLTGAYKPTVIETVFGDIKVKPIKEVK